jgi:preprotein translocase SecE subunit
VAKDKRRQRRRRAANPGPAPSEPHRENVPGELDHASGGVDQFEAALVEGAGGEPVDDDQVVVDDDTALLDAQDAADAEVGTTATERGPAEGRHSLPGASTKDVKGPRFINFLRACWAELQRVQWPDRRQVGQATAVVLGFVVVAGAYLGLADVVAQKIVDLII